VECLENTKVTVLWLSSIDRIVGDCLEIAGDCLGSGRLLKLSGGERDKELAFGRERVTVYPIERWVNLMPCRFGSQNRLRLDLGVS